MDPLTHGVIGLGIAALSGETSLASPVTIGAIVGAMSPDIDIVAKYWGNYKYLKHHRGVTHSVPAVIGLSLAISFILNMIFPGYSFLSIFLSTLVGTASHTFFDALNSYGVRPVIPFKNKRYSASLLMLYDPFVTIMSIAIFVIDIPQSYKFVISLAGLSIYIAYRYFVKRECSASVASEYGLTKENKLHMMPNLTNFFKWDFVLEKDDTRIVGRINSINGEIAEVKRLGKEENELIEKAYSTELGKYFDEFTSSINHVRVRHNSGETELQFIDLRYHMKNDFMHHATFVYDSDANLKQSVFRPYKYDRQIVVESAS